MLTERAARRTWAVAGVVVILGGLSTAAAVASSPSSDAQTLATAETHVVTVLHGFKNTSAWKAQYRAAVAAQTVALARFNGDLSALPKPARTTTTTTGRRVVGNAVTLGSGNFTGGKDVAVGLYNVTTGPGQEGNFIVQGTDSYDEILGGPDGVSEVRANISNGDSIQISGLSQVIFTPVSTPFVTTHSPVTLYAGTWTVGQDIGAGRYVATPGPGQEGNFIIEAEGVDEILGGSDGVPNVSVSLNKTDIIEISGLSQVNMTPSS